MAKSRKSFPLRISQELYEEVRAWAERDMRSVNAQIEYLLRQALARRNRRPRDDDEDDLSVER